MVDRGASRSPRIERRARRLRELPDTHGRIPFVATLGPQGLDEWAIGGTEEQIVKLSSRLFQPLGFDQGGGELDSHAREDFGGAVPAQLREVRCCDLAQKETPEEFSDGPQDLALIEF